MCGFILKDKTSKNPRTKKTLSMTSKVHRKYPKLKNWKPLRLAPVSQHEKHTFQDVGNQFET